MICEAVWNRLRGQTHSQEETDKRETVNETNVRGRHLTTQMRRQPVEVTMLRKTVRSRMRTIRRMERVAQLRACSLNRDRSTASTSKQKK